MFSKSGKVISDQFEPLNMFSQTVQILRQYKLKFSDFTNSNYQTLQNQLLQRATPRLQ